MKGNGPTKPAYPCLANNWIHGLIHKTAQQNLINFKQWRHEKHLSDFNLELIDIRDNEELDLLCSRREKCKLFAWDILNFSKDIWRNETFKIQVTNFYRTQYYCKAWWKDLYWKVSFCNHMSNEYWAKTKSVSRLTKLDIDTLISSKSRTSSHRASSFEGDESKLNLLWTLIQKCGWAH